jgi:hypothetical protein
MTKQTVEERYRDLIERIDPSIKKTRLETEKRALSERFLGAYADAHSQSLLTARHRQALEKAPKVDNLTPDEIRQVNDLLARSRAASTRAQLEEIVRIAAESERQASLIMEHWAEELERVMADLDKLAKVGVVETGAQCAS